MKFNYDYPRPAVTVDIPVFTIKDNDLKILLVRRYTEPFTGEWSLPGGFVGIDESLEKAAQRILLEKTGVDDLYLEQLYTFGNTKRDPRSRVITVAYFALINSDNLKIKKQKYESEVKWFSAHKLPKLVFDHNEIAEYALKRVKWKLEYTTAGFKLLPKHFTLTQLQDIYTIVFNKDFDKRNFRKKVLSLNILEETTQRIENVAYRPAKLYSLKKKIGEIVNIL